MEKKTTDGGRFSASFKAGAIAFIFLVTGYQTAMFITAAFHKGDGSSDIALPCESVIVIRDTVFVSDRTGQVVGRTNHCADSTARRLPVKRHAEEAGRAEAFEFNPNTVSVGDMMRLGFSEKQARSIDAYRQKGGRFWQASDFARSYVVSDTMYRRLEALIRIPKLDINTADSSGFDALPGIGPYFASRMVRYRERLGGYSYPEQLMDIHNFDTSRFAKIRDIVTVGPSEPYRLWSLPEDSLKLHPYITPATAHSIVLYRENTPRGGWTMEGLADAGILSGEKACRLSRCRIAQE